MANVKVDPPVRRIPRELQQTVEMRGYFDFLDRFNHDVWRKVKDLCFFTARSISATYTALEYDWINATNTITITLPVNPKTNAEVIVRNADANTKTVVGNGININGAANYSITTQYESVTFKYFADDDEWFVKST